MITTDVIRFLYNFRWNNNFLFDIINDWKKSWREENAFEAWLVEQD